MIPAQTGDRWIGALGTNNARLSILTGNDSTGIAFAADGITNVTYRNLVITDFNTPLQNGLAALRVRTGGLVENLEVKDNATVGIYHEDGVTIRDSFLHHNGQYGIASFRSSNSLIEGNEISFNNTRLFSMAAEGGGKWTYSNGLVIRNNNVHDNFATGIWIDIDNINVVVENNVSSNNDGKGIHYEASCGGVIRNNTVEGNGDSAGIFVNASQDVEVYNNTVRNNVGGGIRVWGQERGVGDNCVWHVENVNVYDNAVTMASGFTGLQNYDQASTIYGGTVRFTGNDYVVPTLTGTWFHWQGALRTWTQWQGYGQDLTGSITATTSACVGLQVAAGSNLVTVASNAAAGTSFCLAPGTYSVASPIPAQTGDKWIGALVNGARASIITGNDSTRFFQNCTCPDQVWRNFIVERFAGLVSEPNQQDGLTAGDLSRLLVDNVESRFNRGAGLVIYSGSVTRNSYIHDNLWLGLTGNGANNALIEGNEIARNGRGGHRWIWSNGGMKLVHNSNVTLTANHVYSNCGPGLWSDNVETGYLYQENIVHDNFGPGIMHEISYAAIVKNNEVTGNGHGTLGPGGPVCRSGFSGMLGGIYVSTSRDVEVHSNVLLNNDGGIIAQQENRGTGRLGVWESDGLNVHDNSITFQATAANPWHGFRYVGGGTTLTGMSFEGNDYDIPTTGGTWWMWNGLKTWAQWQGLGFDLTGSID